MVAESIGRERSPGYGEVENNDPALHGCGHELFIEVTQMLQQVEMIVKEEWREEPAAMPEQAVTI